MSKVYVGLRWDW